MPNASTSLDSAALSWTPVAQADASTRATFIFRTYLHVALAIAAFAGIEVVLFASGLAGTIAQALLGVNWLLVLGGFMVVGWLASRTAHRTQSLPLQYLALAGFVAAEAIIFVPLLYVAHYAAGGGVIESAAYITLMGFGGLTALAFYTRKDFSFLRGVLMWGGIVALVLIAAGVLFGFQLGTFFNVAMVAFAGAAILYDTSNIIHHYPKDRYVAAALELFSSVALMFWYVLSLLSND
ncbi:Bax inhibitor-1/YccA family protein [Salisaeta longa]|uniref:Bax inhibitor-1/YccA family protein n=1 Tax=Salisaeta longa TaxID=503170 RepID=UPI0003B55B9E|nr:Bax inhibitor-1 family protein [Salisaeta longa]